MITTKKLFLYLYIILEIARLLTIYLCLVSPLFGWFAIFAIDLVDYSPALRGGLTYGSYQRIDKTLDVLNQFYLVVTAYYFGWPVALLILSIFLFRLSGNLFYLVTKSEKFMVLFPNILEAFFPLYLIATIVFKTIFLGTPMVILIFVASTFIKVAHEYALHMRNWIDPLSLKYIKAHPEHRRNVSRK